MNRRKFLGLSALAAAGAALGTVGYTIGIEPHWLEITRRDLPVALLPRTLDGATLALVSDLHVGPLVSDAYLSRSLARLGTLAPDFVVITGDFITYSSKLGDDLYRRLAGVLSQLPRGRLATTAILGNHDYGRNWMDAGVAQRVVAEAERVGVRVLRNEVQSVNGLDLIGVDDLWARRSDTTSALAGRQSDAAIALCHNPDGLDLLDWGEFRGWVLAGHTHGGQCKPPFLPPPVLPVKNKRYTAGEIVVDSRRTLYISRGVGHYLRARFNVRPEITIFTLRRQAEPSLAGVRA